MRRKGLIKKKFLLIIGLGISIPLFTIIILSSVKFKEYTVEIAINDAAELAKEYSSNISKKHSTVFVATNTFADIYSASLNENKVMIGDINSKGKFKV